MALLVGAASSSSAAIDARINTSNFHAGLASELTVDGVISTGGASNAIMGGLFVLKFDPAKVTISNLHAATDWGIQAQNLDNAAAGDIRAVMTNTANLGQTMTGPILHFTVTPANSQVDVDDCATLKLDVGSEVVDQGYYTVYPSDPCGGRNYPIDDNPGDGGELGTRGSSGPYGPTTDGVPDISSAKRVLRMAAGLATEEHWDRGISNPALNDPYWFGPTLTQQVFVDHVDANGKEYYAYHTVQDVNLLSIPLVAPLSMEDQTTLELTDPHYDLVDYYTYPSDPTPDNPNKNRVFVAPGRNFSIQDAIMALRIPLSGPKTAAWTMGFIGNNLTGGNAANATAMPVIAKLDPNGPWNAVFLMGALDGTNYPNPQDTGGHRDNSNPNMVYILADTTGNGGYDLTINPQALKMRDGPMGVALADTQGTGKKEILVSNQQDDYNGQVINGTPQYGTKSHLYMWNYVGFPVSPFAPYNLDTGAGFGNGHTNAAPTVYDLNGDGVPEIFFTSAGQYDGTYRAFMRGGMQIIEPRDVTVNGQFFPQGTNLYQTQITSTVSDPWHLGDQAWQADLQTPPTLIPLSLSDPTHPSQQRNVVIGAYSGDVYAWDATGHMLTNFPVQTDVPPNDPSATPGRASVYIPAVSADVNGDNVPEIVLATGNIINATDLDRQQADAQAQGSHARFNDGAIYCWTQTGQRLWRYPAANAPDMNPAYGGGVAVGRLHGSDTNPITHRTYAPCVVGMDAGGTVVALNGEDGSVFWRTVLPPPPAVPTKHLYSRACVAEPLVLDLNGDGHQDVIIGTTHGEIWILNGVDGSVMWQEHTYRGPDSVTYDGDQDLTFKHYVESQYEEVRGLAVGPLNTGKSHHAILLVTSGRAGLTYPNSIGGHAMLFDLSDVLYSTTPEAQRPRTWNVDAADWPQYQGNAQCTGSYPGP